MKPVLRPLTGLILVALYGCAGTGVVPDEAPSRDPNALLIVDCLLPGKVRQLGTRLTYQAPRRPVKTSASFCEIRGGEYTAYDRANFATALKIWLPRAEQGDAQAQTFVGEIYEKGLGVSANYQAAALWYERAAGQNDSRAMINLGYLYEAGLGRPADLPTAMNWYRRASGLTDGELEYVSSVEYANREAAQVRTRALEQRVLELQARLQESEAKLQAQRDALGKERESIDTLRARVAEQRQLLAESGAQAEQTDTPDDSMGEQTAQQVRALQALETELANVRAERTALQVQLAEQQKTMRDARRAQAEQRAEQDAGGSDTDPSTEGAPTGAGETPGDTAVANAIEQARTAQLKVQRKLDVQTDRLARLEAEQKQAQTAYREHLARVQSSLNFSREEQVRLSERLRDEQLDATRRERSDAAIIAGLDQVVQDRENQLQQQTARLAELEQGLQSLRQRLAGEPGDSPERVRLQQDLNQRNAELLSARAEQSRLSERLRDEQLAARAQQLNDAQQLALLEAALAERESQVRQQQQRLVTLEQQVLQTRVQLQDRDADKTTQVVATGPAIDIIDPPLLVTRGAPTLPLVDDQVDLIGRVTPTESLLTLRINGRNQPWNEAGVFRFASAPDAALELVAVNEAGQSTRLSLAVASGSRNAPSMAAGDALEAPAPNPDAPRGANSVGPQAGEALPVPSDVEFGRYHALVIGNNQHARLSTLNTAENDARAVDRLLRERYDFDTTLLINATRNDILGALNDLRDTLDSHDNLLVYYAGHGEIDEQTRLGYWLPVDADPLDSDQWIANSAITDLISAMPARHVLMVVDSCYSGTLTRSSVARQPPALTPELRARWYQAMADSRVRSVLSSGGVRPVFDGRPGAEHSLFAQAFIDQLQSNRRVLEGYRLFVNVQTSVSDTARGMNVEQSPGYAPIRHAGHEAGEFLFVPSGPST